jgi:hypothetical protein
MWRGGGIWNRQWRESGAKIGVAAAKRRGMFLWRMTASWRRHRNVASRAAPRQHNARACVRENMLKSGKTAKDRPVSGNDIEKRQYGEEMAMANEEWR